MSMLGLLHEMRQNVGAAKTIGLADEIIADFLESHPKLEQAIRSAHAEQRRLLDLNRDLLSLPEEILVEKLQSDLVNFYPSDCVNPYVAIAAVGPWMVTSHGAVLHDSGGYGMLGFGQSPQAVIDTMSDSWVMANVMTPSFSHRKFTAKLKAEVGHTRSECPFDKFVCLNSGSESVTVAARFSDINAKRLTAPGERHEGKQVKFIGLQGAFHGRTDRPAQVSDSCLTKYRKNLRSFDGRHNLVTVPPNDVEALKQAFADADRDGVFFEAMFLEPVMGEGNPGLALTPEYYAAARSLTKEAGTLLLIDSIQAGLRAQGVLSIVDYPGFQELEGPDMETYSKALNAGQYPLSVLALNASTAAMYQKGVYGNTMTTNPRALEVACTVLDRVTPELRANVRRAGVALVEAFEELQQEMPSFIEGVQGTGLLMSVALNPDIFAVIGFGGVEEYCRIHGLGVIHGGTNSLRFTPHFELREDEVALIVSHVRAALIAVADGRQATAQAAAS